MASQVPPQLKSWFQPAAADEPTPADAAAALRTAASDAVLAERAEEERKAAKRAAIVQKARNAFDACEKQQMFLVASGEDPTKVEGCEPQYQAFKKAFDDSLKAELM